MVGDVSGGADQGEQPSSPPMNEFQFVLAGQGE